MLIGIGMGLFLFYSQMRTDIHSRTETQQHSFIQSLFKATPAPLESLFAHAALASHQRQWRRARWPILRALAVAAHRMKVIKIFVEQTDNVWYFTWSNVNRHVWPRKPRKNHFIDLYVFYAIMYIHKKKNAIVCMQCGVLK